MSPENNTARRLLSSAQVCDLMGFSRSTLWKRIRAGKFPSPVKTGENSTRFYEDEVAKVQAGLPRVAFGPKAEAS